MTSSRSMVAGRLDVHEPIGSPIPRHVFALQGQPHRARTQDEDTFSIADRPDDDRQEGLLQLGTPIDIACRNDPVVAHSRHDRIAPADPHDCAWMNARPRLGLNGVEGRHLGCLLRAKARTRRTRATLPIGPSSGVEGMGRTARGQVTSVPR